MARERTGRDIGVIEKPKGSGKWWALVKYRGKQYWRRAANKTHARDLYHEIKTAIRKGAWPPKQEQAAARFDDLLADYRDAKRREGKAVMASNVGYARLLDRFGGLSASEITSDEVDRWRRDLAESMAPATVNLHLCLLRAILRHGLRARRIEAAALPDIRPLKTNNKVIRYLTDDEERRLIGALPEHLRPLVLVAIHTGMRKGELVNLTWADVDFVGGIVWVREAKSGEGRRIPLSATAHKALMELRERRRKRLKAKVINRFEAAGHVFAAAHGGSLMNLNRDWCAAVKRAGLEAFRFHDLRHTFASRLAMAGVDLYRVQTLMGHKTPAMTLRYAHLSPQHLRAAVETLDAPGPKPWAAERAQSGD
jgi:integrase